MRRVSLNLRENIGQLSVYQSTVLQHAEHPGYEPGPGTPAIFKIVSPQTNKQNVSIRDPGDSKVISQRFLTKSTIFISVPTTLTL